LNKNIKDKFKNDDLNNSSASDSTIKRENSKHFDTMPSIDSVNKLENSFNKHMRNNNEIFNFDNQNNIFFDNYIFGVNDWTINEEPVNIN
jgi:hypothetical protein